MEMDAVITLVHAHIEGVARRRIKADRTVRRTASATTGGGGLARVDGVAGLGAEDCTPPISVAVCHSAFVGADGPARLETERTSEQVDEGRARRHVTHDSRWDHHDGLVSWRKLLVTRPLVQMLGACSGWQATRRRRPRATARVQRS
jgi:hypothetical protein